MAGFLELSIYLRLVNLLLPGTTSSSMITNDCMCWYSIFILRTIFGYFSTLIYSYYSNVTLYTKLLIDQICTKDILCGQVFCSVKAFIYIKFLKTQNWPSLSGIVLNQCMMGSNGLRPTSRSAFSSLDINNLSANSYYIILEKWSIDFTSEDSRWQLK